jgi:hypothetical protein
LRPILNANNIEHREKKGTLNSLKPKCQRAAFFNFPCSNFLTSLRRLSDDLGIRVKTNLADPRGTDNEQLGRNGL